MRGQPAILLDPPPYGAVSPLPPSDTSWFKELFETIWDQDLNPHGRLTQEQVTRITKLVRGHLLPCAMGSGPYGDLSINVYEHVDVPSVRPAILFGFHELHLGWNYNWEERFEELSKLTHTPENENICRFYGLPLPRPREQYAY
jgi:hypothetical protein